LEDHQHIGRKDPDGNRQTVLFGDVPPESLSANSLGGRGSPASMLGRPRGAWLLESLAVHAPISSAFVAKKDTRAAYCHNSDRENF
jgi:hypothetical protein